MCLPTMISVDNTTHNPQGIETCMTESKLKVSRSEGLPLEKRLLFTSIICWEVEEFYRKIKYAVVIGTRAKQMIYVLCQIQKISKLWSASQIPMNT